MPGGHYPPLGWSKAKEFVITSNHLSMASEHTFSCTWHKVYMYSVENLWILYSRLQQRRQNCEFSLQEQMKSSLNIWFLLRQQLLYSCEESQGRHPNSPRLEYLSWAIHSYAFQNWCFLHLYVNFSLIDSPEDSRNPVSKTEPLELLKLKLVFYVWTGVYSLWFCFSSSAKTPGHVVSLVSPVPLTVPREKKM